MAASSPSQIAFSLPFWTGSEHRYVEDTFATRNVVGDGPYARKAEGLLQEFCGAGKALLTTSCTHALEMAAILLDLKAGDEIIVPSFTFVSSALAFIMHGARPVFVDICPDTLNLDPRSVEAAITDKTRAIVPVHYAGVACEMDPIMALARANGLLVIEDNAHGLMGEYHGRRLGGIGQLATLSFHATKNVTCGEGGALLINDPKLIERAEIVREKGTNRKRFKRGEIDRYTWVDSGSSYVLSDILAACLVAQLESIELIQAARASIWSHYADRLNGWSESHGIRLPVVPPHCTQTFHMFYLLMRERTHRDRMLDYLAENGIQATSHYEPLHSSPFGRTYGAETDLPHTDRVSGCILRLPLHAGLSAEDRERVTETIMAAPTSVLK